MEKDGADVDLGPAAASMREYAQAGLDTFDMADHCELHAVCIPTWTLRWHYPIILLRQEKIVDISASQMVVRS